MKKLYIKRIKQTLSAILAAAMSLSLFTTIPASAEIGKKTYQYDGYSVDYNVTNEWDGAQTVELTVSNTGTDSILNWALKYDAEGEISNLWNADLYEQNGDEYVIKNVGWNFEIAPSQSITYGYTLSGNNLGLPDNFEICSKRVDKSEGYDIQYNITKSWDVGVEGNIVITNTSAAPIEAWTLSFDSNFMIDNLWNGRVLENNGTSYTVAAEMWTNPVQPNGSITIGFVGSKTVDVEAVLSNFRLTEVVIDDNNNVPDIPHTEVTIPSCVLFSYENGVSTSIEGGSLNVNGNVATNGLSNINASATNINGTVVEHQSFSMPYYHEIIESSYFWNDVNYMSDNCYDPNNIIDIATYSETDYINNSADFEISNTAVMAVTNIDIDSNSFNGNNMVLYSCFGNIDLTSGNVLGSGLIYAPLGTVTIKCDRINFNGIIIAQNIKIIGETEITLNKNEEFINSLGSGKSTITEPDENDSDIIDIGEAYFKEITSPDDVIDSGDGLYCVKRQLLLTADDNVDFEQIRELAESFNASIVGYIELTNDYQIEFNYDIGIDELKSMISTISDIPYVQNVSLNLISYESPEFYSNDSEWNTEWVEPIPNGNDWNIEEIQLESALIEMGVIESESSSYDSATTDALHSVKIGLIDNTFDETHEDLLFTKAWNNSSAPNINDSLVAHGTHVAGTMAAKFNNRTGITGVSIKNRLYAFSYDGETVGKIDPIEELKNATQFFKTKYGLALLIGNNVKVINYSYGYNDKAYYASQSDGIERKAIKKEAEELESFLEKLVKKGYQFTIIAAAGNGNRPSLTGTPTQAEYGNAFAYIGKNSKNYAVRSKIISVGAINMPQISGTNLLYTLRDSSAVNPDIWAPGSNIYSCTIMGTGPNGSNYDEKGGTSMAAPCVSGVVGLCYSICPGLNATMIRTAIITKGSDKGLPQKVVNAKNAVQFINNIKSTFDDVNNNEQNGIAFGYVYDDETGRGLSDVKISAYSQKTNSLIGTAITDDTGCYEIILPPDMYILTFSKDGYKDEMLYHRFVEETTDYLDEVTLIKKVADYNVTCRVTNAFNAFPVGEARIRFREGINNKSGEYVKYAGNTVIGNTDSFSGEVTVILPAGNYTAEVEKDGFITSYNSIVSKENNTVQNITITPELEESEYRIVLTWGNSPRDLDSHLTGNYNGANVHVMYSSKVFSHGDEVIASLDVDDTTCYGPETITINWNNIGESYTYYVYDYTNGGNTSSNALSNSNAHVAVYKGGQLVRYYNVPINCNGTKWNVFSIDTNGNINTINTIGN